MMDDNGRKPSAALLAQAGAIEIKEPYGRDGQFIHFYRDRLIMLRKKYNLTQRALAEVVGCTRVNIVNLETGATNPKLSLLKALAYHFGVTTDWLLGMDEYAPGSEE